MKRFFLFLFTLLATGLAAMDDHTGIVERMPNLVIQLGIIIFAARVGSIIVEKIHIPGVLGELLIGTIIGPYLLGAIPLPGFPDGLFAHPDPGFAIQPELYGFAIIASVILLFLSGLETDISMFLKFSLAGMVVGVGGIVFSFFLGAWTGMYFLDLPIMDPKCLFLGVMSTATSVGITARILSERKRMDTPEGVTILAGAVIDDVLGVILLAIVLGISLVTKKGGGAAVDWGQIGRIAVKEVGIWLGVTALGLYFANRIGNFLKGFKNQIVFSVLAFSIALVVAGLFERVGLAMIIGAYVVGLTLSKTEISYNIQEALHPLKVFFVPVFFVVMGMLVDLSALLSWKTLAFGMVYTVGAVAAKMIGCGIPSLFMGFNRVGAQRIGLGMVPRGEVALIIAGIGLSYGFLKDPVYDIFGIAIFMTLITTLVAPPLLNSALRSDVKGVKDSRVLPEKEMITFAIDDRELCEILAHKILLQFRKMGFFISRPDPDHKDFTLRKDSTNIVMTNTPFEIIFHTEITNALFVRRMVNEASFNLKDTISGIAHLADLHRPLMEVVEDHPGNGEIERYLKAENIILDLQADTREDIVWELLKKRNETSAMPKMREVYYAVVAREQYLSGGLTHGLAIPHAHTDLVPEPVIVIGLKRSGIDFRSIDEKPSYIIVLILTPEEDASVHIRLLARFSKLCRLSKTLMEIMDLQTPQEVRQYILDNVREKTGEGR